MVKLWTRRKAPYLSRKNETNVQQRRLLRGRGDRRQETSWTPEAVASVEKVKKIINKKYQKRTIIGLATGRADAMSLTLSIVQKLTTNLLISDLELNLKYITFEMLNDILNGNDYAVNKNLPFDIR